MKPIIGHWYYLLLDFNSNYFEYSNYTNSNYYQLNIFFL